MVAIFNGGGCDGSQILVSLRDLTIVFFKQKTRPAFVQNKANKFFLYLLFNFLFTIQHALYFLRNAIFIAHCTQLAVQIVALLLLQQHAFVQCNQWCNKLHALIALHYITLQCIAMHYTLHCNALQCIVLHCIGVGTLTCLRHRKQVRVG